MDIEKYELMSEMPQRLHQGWIGSEAADFTT
jgi:hypothetical protein